MAFTFTIATVAKDLQPGWRVSETLNGRNTMTFSVLSLDGTYRPAARAAVEFLDGSDALFAGTIHDKDEAGLGGYGVTPISTSCSATDYNALPDRRQVELAIPAGNTLKQALVLVTAFLSGYGVTLHASQVDGPTFTDALVFEFGPLTSVLNKLSVITGYTWNISYTKVLRMRAPGAEAAPFNIAAGDGNTIGDITVSPSLSDFANKVIVRFSEAARSAYAFLSATANFSNGETVTVGGKAYTFQTTLTDVDGNVKIGTDTETSLTNLANAITLGTGAGTAYATSMSINGSVSAVMQSASLMKAMALAPGASGNSVACTETATNASWITEGGGGTATFLFGSDESLTNYVTATTSPSAADLVEAVYDHPEVRDTATAQALADGYLVRSQLEPREIRYRTLTSGLHPGMSQTIVESRRNLNASCLITAVDITAVGNVLWYDVTAIDSLVIAPDFRDTFRAWSGGGSGGSISASLSGATTTPELLRSGATSFTTGTGWILDYNSGTPQFRIGVPGVNYLSWDGTDLNVVADRFWSGINGTANGSISFWSANTAVLGANPTPDAGIGVGIVTADELLIFNDYGNINLSAPVTEMDTAKITNAMILTSNITPSALGANTDDWNPTGISATRCVRVSASGAYNLTGIVAQADGTELVLMNVGANTITLKHDVTSTAANRFYFAGATDVTLTQYRALLLRYDGTMDRWVGVL